MLEFSAASHAAKLRISEQLDPWVFQDGGRRSCGMGAWEALPSPSLGFQGLLGENPEPMGRGWIWTLLSPFPLGNPGILWMFYRYYKGLLLIHVWALNEPVKTWKGKHEISPVWSDLFIVLWLPKWEAQSHLSCSTGQAAQLIRAGTEQRPRWSSAREFMAEVKAGKTRVTLTKREESTRSLWGSQELSQDFSSCTIFEVFGGLFSAGMTAEVTPE